MRRLFVRDLGLSTSFLRYSSYHPRFPDSRTKETDARTGCKVDYALQLTLISPTHHPSHRLTRLRRLPVPASLPSPQSMLIPSVLLCDWITWDSDEIAPRRTISNGINASFMAPAGYSAPSPSSTSPSPSPFTFARHLANRFHGQWYFR